jgi:hypothetical protein
LAYNEVTGRAGGLLYSTPTEAFLYYSQELSRQQNTCKKQLVDNGIKVYLDITAFPEFEYSIS